MYSSFNRFTQASLSLGPVIIVMNQQRNSNGREKLGAVDLNKLPQFEKRKKYITEPTTTQLQVKTWISKV
jgi:hypothetical protein